MVKINWEYCQKKSDLILSSALYEFKNTEKKQFGISFQECCGNYLITDKKEIWSYVGEGKNLINRIKQQSREKTSTFFKNYKASNVSKKYLEIDDFEFRFIKCSIGRKELEEFAIVNLPTNLNKFNRDKRKRYKGKHDKDIWHIVQDNFHEIIKEGEKELIKSKCNKWALTKANYEAGIYWIEHKKYGVIYIGESSNVYERLKTHSKRTYFSALRRNLGEIVLNFELQIKNGRKRYFSEKEDLKLTSFLNSCIIKTMPISFGRFELEEYLIKKHKPLLNRKGI